MQFLSAMTTAIKRLYNNLLPTPCLLCGMKAKVYGLCTGCIDTLPRLEHACQRCALPITSGDICGRCLKSPPLQQQSISPFLYQDTIKRCISLFKYHHKLILGDFFAAEMALKLSDRDDLPDCIMPIPLHPKRLRHRGFNQSLEIAKRLSKQLDITLDYQSLVRTKNTTSQSELGLKHRRQNIRNAFACKVQVPKHIALIDDVMTSGATTQEAAKILLKQGAETIEIWTVAHATLHR